MNIGAMQLSEKLFYLLVKAAVIADPMASAARRNGSTSRWAYLWVVDAWI